MIKLLSTDGLSGEGLHYIPRIHKMTMIFLHGLGDSAHGWSDFVQMLCRQNMEVFNHIKYILPTAPLRSITANGGMRMPGWADIYGFRPQDKEDEAGYLASLERIERIIQNELDSGIPSQNIFLGGFSQGAALSYLFLERAKKPLGGILALSGWLPFALKRPDRYQNFPAEILKIPILHCHGTDDSIVSLKYGLSSVEMLKKNKFENIFWKEYAGLGHSLCSKEVEDIVEFLITCFKNAV